MSSQPEDAPSIKPPPNRDFNQFSNRIALAISGHSKILSTTAKHRSSVTTNPTPSSSSSTTKPSKFSSLASTTSPQTNGNINQQQPQSRPRRLSREEDDLRDLNPPSAGLGYATPSSRSSSPSDTGSASARDKDTLLLRRKVLGRNAARQLAERDLARGKKRGVAGGGDDSESEEEVGRGALVRRRGKVEVDGKGKRSGSEGGLGPRRKKARVEEPVGGGEVNEVPKEKNGGAREVEDGKPGDGRDVVKGDLTAGVRKGDDVTEKAGQDQTGGEKKRKNKNKKKKKKGTNENVEVEAAAPEAEGDV